MTDESLTFSLSSQELFARWISGTRLRHTEVDLAAPLALDGTVYEAVSVDTTTGYRDLYLFFDDDPQPTPLLGGEVIARRFRALRVAPFYFATRETGQVGSPPFLTQPTRNNQTVVLRLYRQAPLRGWVSLPRLGQFTQDLLITGPAATLNAESLYHLHAPDARIVTFFAGNHNAALPQAVTINCHAVRPEVPRDDGLALDALQSKYNLILGTLTVPLAASADPEVKVLVNPGFTEYVLWVAAAPTVGTYTLTVGFIVQYA